VSKDSGISAQVSASAEDLYFHLGFDVAGTTSAWWHTEVWHRSSWVLLPTWVRRMPTPTATAPGSCRAERSVPAEAYGRAVLDLPLYFPIKALPSVHQGGCQRGWHRGQLPSTPKLPLGQRQLELKPEFRFALPSFNYGLHRHRPDRVAR